MFTEQQKATILERLLSRIRAHKRPLACPMCGHKSFTLADAYLNDPLVELPEKAPVESSLPSFVLVCDCCGFLSRHAIATVGLFPDATRDRPDAKPAEE